MWRRNQKIKSAGNFFHLIWLMDRRVTFVTLFFFNEGFPDAEIKLIAMQNNKVYNFFLEYIIFNTKMLKLLEREQNDNIDFNRKVALIQLFLVQSIIKQ